ncbi:MAG: translocation/assembly module TamB domain-containing protein [Acidobacteriota bacterium]|jgi:outer membrane protein assembly complex protein YaeT|nr:translocation/assembly module TamB domain-containing protein [Acidobacteriota bacterium]
MKRRTKKIIRVLIEGAVLAALALCLLLTPPAKRLAFDYLCRYLNNAAGIRVEASSISLNYFRGRAAFENLTISSTSAPGLPPVFRANHAALDFDVSKALRRKIVIEEITLAHPEIYCFTDKDGNDNLPVLPSSGDGAAPEILILNAGISDSVFRYDNHLKNLFIEIPGWNLDVAGDAQTLRHNLVFENQTDAALRYEDIVLPIRTFSFTGVLDLKNNRLYIPSTRVAADGFSADITGSVDFSGPSIDVTIDASADLRKAAALASIGDPLSGNLSGEIHAAGDFDRLDISARLGISDFSFHSYRQSALELAVKGNWTGDSERLLFPEFAVSSSDGIFTGKADLAAPGTSGANSVSAEIKNLDLRPLIKLTGAPLDIAGRAGGTISLEWEGDFSLDKIAAAARMTLAADFAEPLAGVLPLSGSLNAGLKNNRLEIGIPELRILDIETSGRLTLKNFHGIEGEFNGTGADIGLTIPQIARFLGAEELPAALGELKGPANFHIQAAGNIRQPEISASLETPELIFRKLKAGSRSDFLLRGETLDFTGDFVLPQNSAAAFKGSLDFGGGSPVVSVAAQAARVPAAIINDVFDLQIPLSGAVDASADIGGDIQNPEGKAAVSVNDLSLYEKPLGRLDAELVLSNREIYSEKFLLRRDPENPETLENTLNARFFYALDSGRYDLRADGNGLTLNDWNLPESIPAPEKINLRISGEGTIDQPRVKAEIAADDLKIKLNGEETSLGPVSITADIVSENAAIAMAAPRLNLSAEARAGMSAPYAFTGELRAENSDLSVIGLKPRAGQPIDGSIDAVIRAAGNLEKPEQLEIDADIQSLTLRAQDQAARLFSPARLRYRAGVLEIPVPALLVTRNSQLELSGGVPIGETVSDETLKLKGRLDINEALSFALMPEGFAVDGALIFDVGVKVLDGVFGGEGEIAMERGFVKIPGSPLPFDAIKIKASVEDGALTVRDASAKWGDGVIAVSGELPFRALPWTIPGLVTRDGPVRFKLSAAELTPEMTGIFPSGLTGKVSLHAEGNADRADLESLRAEIIFDELSFKIEALDFYQSSPARIEINNGEASISRLTIIGPETNISLGGSAGLLSAEAPLDLRLNGFLAAPILTFGDPDIRADGRLDINVAAGGTLSSPSLSGYAETDNGRFNLRNPRIVADDLRMRLAITPENIMVEHLSGLLNGGELTGGGSLDYNRGPFRGIDLRMSFDNSFLEAPAGLRSTSSGAITITSKDETIEIGGNVRIDGSTYRESFEIGGQVMNYLRSQHMVIADELTPDSILNRIRYNISVRTITPLLVQNNVARVEASASGLRIVGTYHEPSVIGNITLTEGGEIILNQREYYLDHGTITFANQTRVEPELNIQVHTEVAGYDIILRLAGTPDRLTPILSSEPALPENDVLSLLLTGMTSDETQGQEMQVMQTQALSLLAGQAGEQLTGGARRALGISTFRIDPGFITSESDPGARLTIGEDITRDFSLAYSMNLTNGGDQIWAARYAMPRRLNTQATRQMDDSYRFEFRHDLRFGGANAARTGSRTGRRSGAEEGATRAGSRGNTKFEIGDIRFTGEENFSENTLLSRLSAKPGSRYDFSKIQRGIDRLNEFYVRENYFEADIRVRRETLNDTVNLEFAITPGPVVRFHFEGFSVSPDTRREIEKVWTEGAFEAGRIEDAVDVLRRDMIKNGYLEAGISVETEIVAQDGSPAGVRNVVFHIAPGTLYSGVPLRFSGADEIGGEELRRVIRKAGLELDVYADPGKVVDFIQRYYRDRGYLEARAAVRLNLAPETRSGEAVMEIREGPLFIIGDLEFTGNSAFNYNRLWMVIPTSSGSFYNPETLRNSIRAIENLYRSRGYNDVSATFRVVQDTPSALAHLTFQITERRQSFIEEVEIEGNQRTSLNFVTRQLDFQTGDMLDFEKINESRRRLYSTGVYSSVDFQTDEIAENNADSGRKNMRVRLRLRENAPYRLQYGLYYDTDRGPGGIVETQNMNVMGRASNLGFRLRYDTDLTEARVYYNQPFVRLLHLKMDVSAFWQMDERPSRISTGPDGCDTALYTCANERIGFSLMQERTLPKAYRLDYGYRYERVKLVEREWDEKSIASSPRDENGNSTNSTKFQAYEPVAQLMVTLTRDTRDNILDATRGEFTAHTVGFGPTWLGSQTGFARYSGQYFRYVPLDKYLKLPTRDLEGNAIPTRFVYAGALRLGLASSFGGRNVSFEDSSGEIMRRPLSPERFFAGGGTTMRGFEQDALGPVRRDPNTGDLLYSEGGEGMFLFNNEIRFPLWSIVNGVLFLDVGNVYERLSDFDFTLRKSAGAGLRFKIKSIPLRFDYGFKLDKRRPGERGSALFFSIGQAF